MKKIPFLIFTALIIISASICIILEYKVGAMTSLIIGFICGTAFVVYIIVEQIKDTAQEKTTFPGGLISASIAVGVSMAFLTGFLFSSGLVSLLSFLGSALGGVMGCMFKGEITYFFKSKRWKNLVC